MTTGNVAMATQRVRRASGARIVTEEANDAADHASGCPVETCHDRRQRADVQGDVDRVPRACGDEPPAALLRRPAPVRSPRVRG
jgi:hypothetical protein